jgi:uncharacterized protein YndB with AHSA1/START domain
LCGKTEGDKYVVVTRRFAASPEAVYRAHTKPRLIQKWLLDPDGGVMPVCVSEPQAAQARGGGFGQQDGPHCVGHDGER